ncbi:MAG: CPBP family intramembrane metalloprotease [Myxococcales bacterium]|nr:CPBP family intramembrane metalloprotease [Myxococcales bacterium]
MPRIPAGFELLLLFAGAFFVAALVTPALVGPLDGVGGLPSPTSVLLNVAAQQLLAVLGVAVLVWRVDSLEWADVVGTRPRRIAAWTTATVCLTTAWAIAQVPVIRLWASLTGTEQPQWWDEATSTSGGALALSYLVLAVIAPICEETFFRGVFQYRLAPLGRVLAVAVQAGGFVLFHLDVYGMPAYLVAGLALGALRSASGTLWLPVLAHALHNALGVLELGGAGATWDRLGSWVWPTLAVLLLMGGAGLRHALRRG